MVLPIHFETSSQTLGLLPFLIQSKKTTDKETMAIGTSGPNSMKYRYNICLAFLSLLFKFTTCAVVPSPYQHDTSYTVALLPRDDIYLTKDEWNDKVNRGNNILCVCQADLRSNDPSQSWFDSQDPALDYFQISGYTDDTEYVSDWLEDFGPVEVALEDAYDSEQLQIDGSKDQYKRYLQDKPFISYNGQTEDTVRIDFISIDGFG